MIKLVLQVKAMDWGCGLGGGEEPERGHSLLTPATSPVAEATVEED